MNTVKVLAELDFQGVISEAMPQTQSGSELLKNYKAYLLTNPVSCRLVNSFVNEAASMVYDKGIKNVVDQLSDYLTMNKVGWQIASVCERLSNSTKQTDYLNKSAARQAVKLLEMEEEDIVKYIKSGALKNIMFCEAFRTIANGVFRDSTPLFEQTNDYTKTTPVSMVENLGDCVAFVVMGKLFTQDIEGQVQESNDWDMVSQTFKDVTSLLNSQLIEINEDNLEIKYNDQLYKIVEEEEEDSIKLFKNDQEMSIDELREDNELYMRIVNPRRKNEVGRILESIALLAENYNKVAALNNVQIYSTKNDRFMVIENGTNLIAMSLASNHQSAWKINEDAIKVLEYIKTRTNVMISENYTEMINKSIEKADDESREQIQESLRSQSILTTKERIELLTEKFKNDPAKLAILSKCAAELGDM